MHRKSVGFSNMYAINIFYMSHVRFVVDYASSIQSLHQMFYINNLYKSAEKNFFLMRTFRCGVNSLDFKSLMNDALSLMLLSFVKF